MLVLFLNIECVVPVAGVGIYMLFEAICIQRLATPAGRACRVRKVRRAGAYPKVNSLNTEQQRGGGQ